MGARYLKMLEKYMADIGFPLQKHFYRTDQVVPENAAHAAVGQFGNFVRSRLDYLAFQVHIPEFIDHQAETGIRVVFQDAVDEAAFSGSQKSGNQGHGYFHGSRPGRGIISCGKRPARPRLCDSAGNPIRTGRFVPFPGLS